MATVDPSPLVNEFPQCLGAMIANDRGGDVLQAKSLAQDYLFQHRLVDESFGVNTLENAPKGNCLSELRFRQRELVVHVPKDVHDIAHDPATGIGWNGSHSSHANSRIFEWFQQPAERSWGEYDVAPEQYNKRVGRLTEEKV